MCDIDIKKRNDFINDLNMPYAMECTNKDTKKNTHNKKIIKLCHIQLFESNETDSTNLGTNSNQEYCPPPVKKNKKYQIYQYKKKNNI